MAVKTYPVFGGGAVGSGQITFPLIAPTPGAAGSEPFRFATGGGIHGDSSGGVALSVAAGDAVSVDAQANVALPQRLTVAKLAQLSGGVSSPSASLGQLTVTGDTSLGGNIGVAGSVQVTGDLTGRKITATSDLSAASLSTQGHIAGGSLTITGQTTLAGLDVQGTFHASDIQSDGNFYFPASSPNAPGIALADQHGTGLFAAAGTLGVAVAGQSALSFGGDLKANFAGTVVGGSAQFADVAATTLEASAKSTLHAVQATTLALSDAAVLASNLDVQGNLQVEGTTRLANLAIDMLSTDHDLTVGGNALVKGTTTLQGALSVQGGVTATGPGSFSAVSTGQLNASTIYFSRLRQGGSSNQNPYVDNDVTPGGMIVPYTALLAPEGVLKIAGAFTSLAGGSFGGDVSMGSLAAANGAFSGGGAFGGAVTAASLAVTGAITALTSKVGGSKFQTCHGVPNGQVAGSVGDWVIDVDAGQAYLKQSGTATSTGWVEVTTQANATGFPLLAPDTAPAAVPFSFASDGGTGLGRNAQNPLYLALGGSIVLSFASGGGASLAAGLAVAGALSAVGPTTLQGALTVQGATQLQALTAGTSHLGDLTAGNTTLGDLSCGNVQGAAGRFSGVVLGAAAGFASVEVDQDVQVGGDLSVLGAAELGDTKVQALHLGGLANLSGSYGDPTGNTPGSPGDFVFAKDGNLWIKTAGQGTNTGWSKVATSASGLAFPLAAPLTNSPQSPSYGFAGCQMGITDGGANVLYAVTGGLVGWTLDAGQNFSLGGNLSGPANASFGGTLQVGGASTLAQVSAGAISGSGTLSIAGASALAAVTAAAITATSLTTTTGSVTAAQDVTAAATVSGGLVVSNGATWRAAATAPSSSVGSAGDIASIRGASDHPLQVRVGSAWKPVALVGDPTPSQFPLTGPVDSATAPNYSTQLSPNTGMYFPAANQIAWSTNGLRAGSVDAGQNWSFVGSVTGAAATFSGLTVNGNSSLTGNISIGGTLQATGMATFASSITAQSAAISQGITAAQATINGPLGVQTVTTTGDVVIGGNLQVSGTTTYNGVNRAGYYQVGDGTVSAPAYAFTSETGLGMWRKGAANLAFAAAGANLLSLTAGTAAFSGSGTFPGTVAAAVVDAPVVRNSGGTLALQAGTSTIVSVASAAISAAAPIYIPAGSSSAPGLVIGAGGGLFSANDTRPAYPVSVSLTNPRGGGISLASIPDYNTGSTYFLFGHGAAGISSGGATPNGYAGGAPGHLYQNAQGGSGASLWVYESTSSGTGGWVAVRTASQPVVPTYPAVGPAGTAAAPTFAVGSANTGLFAGTDAMSRSYVGLSQGGAAVARLATFTNNSTAVYLLGLGDPTSGSVSGGLVASAQAPATGAPLALPGMVFEDTRGGPGPLWVNESTTTTPTWVRVLTASSQVAASFPLLAPADSAAAPSYSWAAETGLGWYRSAAATMVAVAAGAPLATLTTNLVTLPGALRIGGTNAGLTSPAANQVAVQTAGVSALSIDASQNVSLAAKLTVTGLTSGSSSAWSTSTTTPLLALTETTAPSTGTAGQLYVKSSDHNLYFVSSTGTTTQLTPPGATFPLVGPIGSAAAPTFQAGAGNGLYATAAATGLAYNGAQAALLTASLMTLPGALQVGGTNAGLAAPAANTLQLQTAGTAALSVDATQNATFAAKITAAGLATLSGGLSSTTASLSTSLTLPLALFTETTAPATTTAGQLFVKSSDHNLYFLTSTGTTYQLSPAQPAFPLLGPAGSATAATYAVGVSSSGLYGYNTTSNTYLPAITQNGAAAAWFLSTTLGGNAAYGMVLGDPANRLTAGGGLVAGSVAPTGGIYAAPPGQLYQHLGGGAAASLYVAEHTSGLSSAAWAKVLTTSSTITPTYPLVGPAGSATACTFAAGAANTGLYAYNFGTNNNTVVLANNGGPVAWFFQTTLGSQPAFGMTLGSPANNATVGGGMYAGSVAPGGGIYAGTPAQLYQHMGGGAGASLYVAEQTSGQSSAAWAKVLTTGSQLASANLAQTTAPAALAAVTKLYSDANGLLRLVVGTQTPNSAPVVRQDVLAFALAASQTLATANNGATLVASAATQYTATLPAAVTGVDLIYRFQVENAAGVVVKASAGQIIQYGTSASATAGTLTSTAVGSTVELFLRAGATAWYARGAMGSWTVA